VILSSDAGEYVGAYCEVINVTEETAAKKKSRGKSQKRAKVQSHIRLKVI